MTQSPVLKKTTKEFDRRLRCIIKEHWMDFEPPSGVWDLIQNRLESKTDENNMHITHAFPSKAVVRVLSRIDPDDPTRAPNPRTIELK